MTCAAEKDLCVDTRGLYRKSLKELDPGLGVTLGSGMTDSTVEGKQ